MNDGLPLLYTLAMPPAVNRLAIVPPSPTIPSGIGVMPRRRPAVTRRGRRFCLPGLGGSQLLPASAWDSPQPRVAATQTLGGGWEGFAVWCRRSTRILSWMLATSQTPFSTADSGHVATLPAGPLTLLGRMLFAKGFCWQTRSCRCFACCHCGQLGQTTRRPPRTMRALFYP